MSASASTPADTLTSAGSAQPALEIECSDVVRLMMQFMREQGLSRSLAALQEESGVSLNLVDDGDALQADVLAGRWDSVLSQIAGFSLPAALQARIYEQVVRELVEARETEVARTLLRTTMPLLILKREDPSRYARLEHIVSKTFWDPAEAYGIDGSSKEGRRHEIARALSEHLLSVSPGRLLTLLSQAVRYQHSQGTLPAGARFDLFRGCVPLRKDVEERLCAVPASAPPASVPDIAFGAAAYPVAADFTPDGSTLVVGCVDGIIEAYGADSGKLRLDLPYQAADEFMLHDDAILSLAISKPDGELLATGSRDGALKVWRIATGECLRKFAAPHSTSALEASASGAAAAAGGPSVGAGAGGTAVGGAGGGAAAAAAAASGSGSGAVTALAFTRDGTQLLSGGFDGIVKLHGLRSGKTLKEYRGHAAGITSIAVAGDGSVVTSSSDGTVRVWDGKSTECIAVVKPPQASAAGDAAVLSVHIVPRTPDHILITPRAGAAYIATLRGQVLRTLTLPPPSHTTLRARAQAAASLGAAPATGPLSFVCTTVSAQGRFVYAVAEDKALYVFATKNGALEATLQPSAASSAGGAAGGGVGEALGLIHHPLRNLMASYGSDGVLRAWQPPALAEAASFDSSGSGSGSTGAGAGSGR